MDIVLLLLLSCIILVGILILLVGSFTVLSLIVSRYDSLLEKSKHQKKC